MVKAAWKFFISEKSRISVFLESQCKIQGRNEYRDISAVFCKTFGQTGHFHFDNLCTKRKTKLCCLSWFAKVTFFLSVGVLFGSVFVVHVAGATKLFFVIVTETILLHLNSLVLTNYLYCCTQLVTKCDVWSDLDTWILQQRTDWEQSSNYGGIIFPKHSIVCWIMLVVMGVILFGTFEYFLSTCFKYSAISGLAPAL